DQELRNTPNNTDPDPYKSADLFKFVTPEAMSTEAGHLAVSTDLKEWWYQIQFTRVPASVIQNNGVDQDLTQVAITSISNGNENRTWWKITGAGTDYKIVAYDGNEFGFTGSTSSDKMKAVATGNGNSFQLRNKSGGAWGLEMGGTPPISGNTGSIYPNDQSSKAGLYSFDQGSELAFIPKYTNWITRANSEIDVAELENSEDEIVFRSDDTGTGQLTGATSFTPLGKVKLIKTFKTNQWYPIGFPFAIDNNAITITYGTTTVAGVIYDGDTGHNEFTAPSGAAGSKGNFFVKKYDADINYFVFDDAITPNIGYIIEFPKDEFKVNGEGVGEVVVTFVSTASPELTIGATGTGIPSENTNLSLIVNPNVSNITGIVGAKDYYQYDYEQNRFSRIGEDGTENVTLGETPLKPFEAIIAVKTGTSENDFRSSIGDGLGGTTALEPLPGVEEPREVRYYTMQGIRIYSPQVNGVYIVKKVYASGKTDISKVIYKNKGL
ncbi:MAG: hypothetical protein LBM08_15000, partial [Dysgonamonadaceae bacterium]|nr:hypothetical protein [Dysgonamonadaceae bacterium]